MKAIARRHVIVLHDPDGASERTRPALQDGQMLGVLAGEQLQYATDANGHARQGRPARRHIVMLSVPPSLIVDAPGLRVWHKLDQTFRHALLHFQLLHPTT